MTSPSQPHGVPDEVIVSHLRKKEPYGLTQLLSKYGGRAKWWLQRDFGGYCVRGGELDEALNEATLNVWNSIHTYQEDRGSLWAWFYRIARNAALQILRREAQPQAEALDMDGAMPEGAEVLGQGQWSGAQGGEADQEVDHQPTERHQEFTKALRQCIAALSVLQRRVIQADLLVPDGGVADTRELARTFKTSVNSIKSSRSQARKKIKRLMQARGFYADEESGGDPIQEGGAAT